MPRSPGTGNALSTHHPRGAARHTHHTTHPPATSHHLPSSMPGFPTKVGADSRFPGRSGYLFQVSRQKQAPYGRNRTANLESKEESEESSLPHER